MSPPGVNEWWHAPPGPKQLLRQVSVEGGAADPQILRDVSRSVPVGLHPFRGDDVL
jgi:hypothetical protein